MSVREDIQEMKKEIHELQGIEEMNKPKENESLATEVIKLMKKSLKRMYGLLIIFVILFVIAIVDSIYQRCRIINILREFEVPKETVIETNDKNVENDKNSFIGEEPVDETKIN